MTSEFEGGGGYRRFGNRVQRGKALAALPRLDGKVVLVTGGTDGVGRSLVELLAGAGATTLFTARDAAKGERVRAEVMQTTGNEAVEVVMLDLASLASVGTAGEELVGHLDRLDLLIANAGHQARRERTTTADGFETTFGVNHLGHAELIRILEPLLRASAPSHVVVVASEAHRRARNGLDFDDLMMERGFNAKQAYNRSKLANILYTREQARRLDGTGVRVNCAHPGGVDTPMMRANFTSPITRWMYPVLRRAVLVSAHDAAASVLRVALDSTLVDTTGEYFELGRAAEPTEWARDDAAAARLWAATESLLAAT